MGFSSLEAGPIVNGVMERGQWARCRQCRLEIEQKLDLPYREVGVGLANGKYWEEVDGLFEEVVHEYK